MRLVRQSSDPVPSATRQMVRRARSAARVLAPFGRPYRRSLIGGSLWAFGVVACRLAFPWPLRGVMETVFAHRGGRGAAVVTLVPAGGDPVVWLTASFVAIILLWGLAEHLQRLFLARYAAGMIGDARSAALHAVSVRRESGVQDDLPGDVISRIVGDGARVKSGIKGILIGVTRNGVFFLGVAAIVMFIDPVIGLVFLAGGVAVMGVAFVGMVRVNVLTRKLRRKEGRLVDKLHRLIAHGKPSAALTRAKRSRPADSPLTRLEGRTTMAIHAILAGSTCVILLLSIRAGQSGRLSPGSVFTILIYVLLMHNKTVSLGRQTIRVGRLLASAERLAKIVQTPEGCTYWIPPSEQAS